MMSFSHPPPDKVTLCDCAWVQRSKTITCVHGGNASSAAFFASCQCWSRCTYSVVISYCSVHYQKTPLYLARGYMQLMICHVRMLSLLGSCHTVLRSCGEAQSEATHVRDLVSSSLVRILVYTVFVSSAPLRTFCV